MEPSQETEIRNSTNHKPSERASKSSLESLQAPAASPAIGRIRRRRSSETREQAAERRQQKNAEVQQITDEALTKLEQELSNGKSETLKQFLKTVAQFHSYSFRNLMLIMMQQPDATRVAGFNAWKKLGRQVLKGEKGIRIFAPMSSKAQTVECESDVDQQSDSQNPVTKLKRLRGFKVVSVFDISQTEGKPLPDIGHVHGDPGQHLPQLHNLIRDRDIQLDYEDLGGAEGVSRGGSIAIQVGLHPAKEFLVLAHELAHEMMHRGERRGTTSKNQRELEAEAVGYVVSQAFGVDTSSHTSDYIQLYNGDADALRESLDVIRRTAAIVINQLNKG